MAQKKKSLTDYQKQKIIHDKQNTLATMSEIIRLRYAVEGKSVTDEQVFKEAGESLKKTGSYMSKIKGIMKR